MSQVRDALPIIPSRKLAKKEREKSQQRRPIKEFKRCTKNIDRRQRI